MARSNTPDPLDRAFPAANYVRRPDAEVFWKGNVAHGH
jgi:hypothetical protein